MISITRKKPTYESGIAKDGAPFCLYPASKNTFAEIIETAAGFQREGGDVTAEELSEIDPMTAATIIREYTAFMRGLQKDPN